MPWFTGGLQVRIDCTELLWSLNFSSASSPREENASWYKPDAKLGPCQQYSFEFRFQQCIWVISLHWLLRVFWPLFLIITSFPEVIESIFKRKKITFLDATHTLLGLLYFSILASKPAGKRSTFPRTRILGCSIITFPLGKYYFLRWSTWNCVSLLQPIETVKIKNSLASKEAFQNKKVAAADRM